MHKFLVIPHEDEEQNKRIASERKSVSLHNSRVASLLLDPIYTGLTMQRVAFVISSFACCIIYKLNQLFALALLTYIIARPIQRDAP